MHPLAAICLFLLLTPKHRVAYDSTPAIPDEAAELRGVQAPIARKDRIFNNKGNCVWCSLETLARLAKIKNLYNISKHPNEGGDRRCQGAVWDGPVREVLREKQVRYVMVGPFSKNSTQIFIEGCKKHKAGVAFDIDGHMLTCVHYDPDTKTIKVIDNLDRKLAVQTWDWDRFHREWKGWAFYLVP